MAVETLRFMQPGQADTTDRVSDSIWADCPRAAIRNKDIPGAFLEDDFTTFNITAGTTEGNWAAEHGYSQFASATGTITAGTGTGGEIILGATADNEGVGLRTTATPFKIIRGGLGFWYEIRMKVSSIADTKSNFFVGLMTNNALTAISPITALGALADVGLVGFHRPESALGAAGTGGATVNFEYKASGITAVSQQKDIGTLVADTYIKLGLKYVPGIDPFNLGAVGDTYGKFLLYSYVNGVAQNTPKQIPSAAGTDFPNNVGLGLVMAILDAAGSATGTTTIDWVQAYQAF
ncbi:MAG: hypothetical protein V4510_13175 [bacterium]